MTQVTGFDLCRSAMSALGVTAPEQSVLTVLAIMANEQAQCWPSIAALVAKTKLSERTVQGSVKALDAAGHITRVERKGHGVIYTVHPRAGCTPANKTPPQEMPPAGDAATPAGDAPKLPRTTIPKKATPSRVARAKRRPSSDWHRLPSDWKPSRFKDGTAAREVADRRGPAWCKAQLEDFHAWAANAEDKPGKGRKLDWQQAFAKWINEQGKKDNNHGRPRQQHSEHSASGLGRTIDAMQDFVRLAEARGGG